MTTPNDGVERLSEIVSHNDHLTTEPGLAVALMFGNATAAQAGAIDQFLGGLKAEQMVRSAAAGGQRVTLSSNQQALLDSMGINYSNVLKQNDAPQVALRKQMATQGVQPVTKPDGSVSTDAKGNPHVEPIASIADAMAAFGSKVTVGASSDSLLGVIGSVLDAGQDPGQRMEGRGTALGEAADLVNKGYNLASAAGSYAHQQATNPAGVLRAGHQEAELARRLGYDPTSIASMLAFRAKGYAFNDNSSVARLWDKEHPQGFHGFTGDQAIIEAEAFADDPSGYIGAIESNTALTPKQVAEKLKFASTPEFQQLVMRVQRNGQSIGNDIAKALTHLPTLPGNVDPVHDPGSFSKVATVMNTAATFVADPLAIGLSAYSKVQRASVAMRGAYDSEGITRILRAGIDEGTTATAKQYAVQQQTRRLIDLGLEMRAAHEAGDTVALAQAQAKAAAHPLGGFLADFAGLDRIARYKTAGELERSMSRGDYSPWVMHNGPVDPISTYDQAVDYIASKGALLRLVSGNAPVEFSTMPGALSSFAFSRLRGDAMAWSAGVTRAKTNKAVTDLLDRAEADPAYARQLWSEKLIDKVLPQSDDAIDVLSGRVLAAQEDVKRGIEGAQAELASARRALAQREQEVIDEAPFQVTPAGEGAIRRNQLDFGRNSTPGYARKALQRAASDSRLKSAVGNAQLSLYGLPGVAQRARLVVSRMTNQLPKVFKLNVNSAADAETVRRFARTYMTAGDADLMAALWTTGGTATRKSIAQGIRQQVFHAAGLSRTAMGRSVMDEWAAKRELYSLNGQEWLDRNGVAAGQFPGQMAEQFTLPGFGDIHRAAAKIGLMEATLGRFLGSGPIYTLTNYWRTAILGTFVTANRATVEALGAATVDRDFGLLKTLAAKSVLRENGVLKAQGLRRARWIESLAEKALFRDVGRMYRTLLKQSLKPEEIAALEANTDLAIERMLEQSRLHWAQISDPASTAEAEDIAMAGLKPVQIGYDSKPAFDKALAKRTGVEVTDHVDGQAGAHAYAWTLGSRVNDDPELAVAVLDRIEHGKSLDSVIKALDESPLMRDSLYSRVYRVDGRQFDAVTKTQVEEAKRQWAQGLVDDYIHAFTSRNGNLSKKLTEYVREHGQAPDGDWILANLKGMELPQAVMRPTYAAVPQKLTGAEKSWKEVVQTIAEAAQEGSGKIYQRMVEQLIQRNATSPIYGLAYAKARVGLEPLKQEFITAGLSEEAAETLVKTNADRLAFNRVALMVDNPAIRMQMDVASRSFFAFSRATTSMLRRWATIGWKNPAQARRLQLAYESAQHSGLIYDDPVSGEPMFLMPMTGVAMEAIAHLMSNVPGFENFASFPITDFQGRLASIIPGSNNPFQYNTTPFVSISGRWLASLVPNHREMFDEVDAKLNGTQGQGKGILDTILPRLFQQYSQAEIEDGRNSVMNSAMVGALMNLAAAGKLPPDGASPAQMQEFYDNLKSATKNVLGVRFLLGIFSPASTTTPEGTTPSDFAWAQQGIKSMRDEFVQLVNGANGDYARALAVWTYMHPDLSIFTQSSTRSLTKNATIDATHSTYQWMASHSDFIKKYRSISAYFVPPAKPGEGFDMQAWRAEVEQGFRERKTPAEFIDSWRISSAMGPYYSAEANYRQAVAQAKASGKKTADLNAAWKKFSDGWKARHPSFATYLAGASANAGTAQDQFRDLEYMVKNGDVPGDTSQREAVAGLVQAYRSYQQFYDGIAGTTAIADAERKAATAKLQGYVSAVAAAHPELKDLINGVLHTMDNHLEYIA